MSEKLKIIRNTKHIMHKPDVEFDETETKPHQDHPDRIKHIEAVFSSSDFPHEFIEAKKQNESILHPIHTKELIKTIKQISEDSGETEYSMPYVFPSKIFSKHTTKNIKRSNAHCMDMGTPIGKHTFSQALISASIAYECADRILNGEKLIYGLCRPPGHHAESNTYGGYCYFNNAGVCSSRLYDHGKVCVLDIDYHHGNGTQEIFYETDVVMYVSIHGDPHTEYPYYTGYYDETGSGKGLGYNLNYPLPKGTTEEVYLNTLVKALDKITKYNPDYLIVSLGLDAYKNDPICDFTLDLGSYNKIGNIISELGLPIVVLQEGGYCREELGNIALSFFRGISGLLK